MREQGYYGRSGILWDGRDIMKWPGYYGRTGIFWEKKDIMGGPGYYGRAGILLEYSLLFFKRIESLPHVADLRYFKLWILLDKKL